MRRFFLSQPSTQAISAVTTAHDTPRQMFKKELIQLGHYVDDDQHAFEVTPALIDNWILQFDRMTANGNEIELPSEHATAGKPDSNNGYLRALYRVGDSLFGNMEMIGQNAIDNAARANVSLQSPEEVDDGKGNVYPQPIEHVAVTTRPRIPGLLPFMPIAASQRRTKETEMDWPKIKAALGIDGEVTEENAQALILSRGTALTKIVTEANALAETLKAETVALTAKLLAAGGEVTKPAAQLVSLSADNREMKIKHLQEAGVITPAVGKKLADIFIGAPGEHAPLKLSLSHGPGDQFDLVVAALAGNNPRELVELSGAQTMTLSHDAQGNDVTCETIAADRAKQAMDADPNVRVTP